MRAILIVIGAEEKDAEADQNKFTPFPAAEGGVREGVGGGLSIKSEMLSRAIVESVA